MLHGLLIDGTHCNINSFLWFKNQNQNKQTETKTTSTKQTSKQTKTHQKARTTQNFRSSEAHSFGSGFAPWRARQYWVWFEQGEEGCVRSIPSYQAAPSLSPKTQGSNLLIFLFNLSCVLCRGKMRLEGLYSGNACLQMFPEPYSGVVQNLSRASC